MVGRGGRLMFPKIIGANVIITVTGSGKGRKVMFGRLMGGMMIGFGTGRVMFGKVMFGSVGTGGKRMVTLALRLRFSDIGILIVIGCNAGVPICMRWRDANAMSMLAKEKTKRKPKRMQV
ncbi:hypothetical protein Fmac_005126 [Flemingia macrophylla]|uniref:Uncharacterized protein n=1 Tax=Flemingia macrophylla TaxID=520843 RepID=A0ABD1N6U8_9FABA